VSRERDILDLIADAVLITDDESVRVVEANTAAARLLGYGRDELVGMRLADLSAEPEESLKAFGLRTAEIPLRRYRRKDGSTVALEITTVYGQWMGRTVHVATYRDVSAREAALCALRQSEERLQRERNHLLTLINNLPDHIYLRDRESRFILANRAVAEFMGAGDPGALVGKKDSDFYPPEVAAQFAADDRLILEQGRCIINQERCDRSASGALRWIMTTKVPIIDESGRVQGLVGIGRDFTESRETKEALRRSQEQLQQGLKMEAIGRLAGGIAHDFNNLLTVIKGFAELIDGRLPHGDPSKMEIAEIRGASQRAARLTAQLLAFGRKQILQPRVMPINDVVQAMRNMLPRILGEDIELSICLGRDAGRIRADQGQLEQVIMNLSVNARDAMPRGGRLAMATDNCVITEDMKCEHPELRTGPYVTLRVTDTGTGMDAATLSRIFEPFFTTKAPGKGTGLGLSTVYGIIKQSGGFIYCDSTPGAGTSFVIYFPRVFEQGQESRPEGRTAASGSGSETVLLVEDEEALRGFVRSTLEKSGYTVIDAGDGISALEILSRGERSFDVLVTDVVMPRMGGQELVRRVLESRPATRVLYMSGYAEESIMPPPLDGRPADLIRKPFDGAALLSRLRDVLDRA
jgi:two-component system, cell cycle sensor histidine kinase and response regulator CckA